MTAVESESQVVTYEIDPMHSSAQFRVRHFMIASVRGEFSGISGTLLFDPNNVSSSSVQATIDASTFNSGQPQRDEHVKSSEFLDVAAYPTMTYQSKSISLISMGNYKVIGDLTLHGVTQEVALDVEGPSQEVKDLWGGYRVGASATTRIDRKDFALVWNAPLETGGVVLSEEVDITLDLQFVRKF